MAEERRNELEWSLQRYEEEMRQHDREAMIGTNAIMPCGLDRRWSHCCPSFVRVTETTSPKNCHIEAALGAWFCCVYRQI